jgi:hypothetical protein
MKHNCVEHYKSITTSSTMKLIEQRQKEKETITILVETVSQGKNKRKERK